MFKLSLSSDTGYVELADPATGIKVGSLLYGLDKRPTVIAMSLARYSRSNASMGDISKELLGKDNEAKLENIAIKYGHASVAGMAHIAFCAEDISTLDAMRFFYECSVLDGQHRSTRYQDFSNARFLAVPSNMGNAEVRELYKQIVNKQLKDYKEVNASTKEALSKRFDIQESNNRENSSLVVRTLDCTRYLLPLALKDGFGAVISAREISSRYISKLLGSKDPVSKRLGELLIDLFTKEGEGYTPECASLIKHTEAKKTPTKEAIQFLESRNNQEYKRWPERMGSPSSDLMVNEVAHMDALVLNLELLMDPLRIDPSPCSNVTMNLLGNIIFKGFNHHNELGNPYLSGSIAIQGMADIGSIKDLIRHRSLRRFVPLFEDETNMIKELDRPSDKCYYLPPYFYDEGMDKLREDYTNRLTNTYESIKDWYTKAISCMEVEVANHYVKRLLPHAHATQYILSGSMADIAYMCSLRKGVGGHIQYRMMAENIISRLTYDFPLWDGLFNEFKSGDLVDPFSREQFLGRS
jgi:thymidylate synthase ThyX